jgi:hypothetical protein
VRPANRTAWLGATLALLLIGGVRGVMLPYDATRFMGACAALAGWMLAHWGCPQPIEASPIVTCGMSHGLPPLS